MESKLSSTLQLLRGIELLYPNEESIKLVRSSLESLKAKPEPDHNYVLKSFFNLFKIVTKDQLIVSLERLCLPNNNIQSIISIISLTSIGNPHLDILFNLKHVKTEKIIHNNNKILLSYIDQHDDLHKVLKDILLSEDSLIKIQKVIPYYRARVKSESDDIYDLLRKFYNNIHQENFDHHLWKLLYKITNIYLFDRIKLINLKYPDSRIHEAFSKGQLESKLWLTKELQCIPEIKIRDIHIMCGWYAVLAYLIYHNIDDKMNIRSYDVDANCLPISDLINHPQRTIGRFMSWERDIYTKTYYKKDTILINTSCEHLRNFHQWFSSIPLGQYVVLQSNDFFSCEEHSNCSESLEDFRKSAPLSNVLFSGELKLEKYTRFMLIGTK